MSSAGAHFLGKIPYILCSLSIEIIRITYLARVCKKYFQELIKKCCDLNEKNRTLS